MIFRFSPLPLVLVALFAFSGVLHCEEEKSKEEKKARKERRQKKAADSAMQAAFPPELTSMFPIGREFKGVAIPSYTEDVLKSVMNADSVTRINEQFLDLVNLRILIYNSEGEPETTIFMELAAYDLLAGELRSKTPSRIEQPRFTMTGDQLIFETQSQRTRLIGNVHVVIPDASEFTPLMGLPAGSPSN
ncbi:MAG: hypothetical protein CMO55_10815 [Verrucomicrobiales bacterium]|nr:hypothetical protein [Verrucomicrobiales bacterium]